MTAPKAAHTPGPWIVGDHPRDNSGTGWREILANGEFGPMYLGQALEPNAARIVACVNACEGMDDPAHGIKETGELLNRICAENQSLRADVNRLRGQLERIAKSESYMGGNFVKELQDIARAALGGK